ncbi:MAG: hypothetical protein DHS20C02_10160 [Micavibrio sp.]|nr:MAG: hypothetical protein DHS20C02_10160 [Micavibrio sp.]
MASEESTALEHVQETLQLLKQNTEEVVTKTKDPLLENDWYRAEKNPDPIKGLPSTIGEYADIRIELINLYHLFQKHEVLQTEIPWGMTALANMDRNICKAHKNTFFLKSDGSMLSSADMPPPIGTQQQQYAQIGIANNHLPDGPQNPGF